VFVGVWVEDKEDQEEEEEQEQQEEEEEEGSIFKKITDHLRLLEFIKPTNSKERGYSGRHYSRYNTHIHTLAHTYVYTCTHTCVHTQYICVDTHMCAQTGSTV